MPGAGATMPVAGVAGIGQDRGMSIRRLAEDVLGKRISARELVELALERIERHDPALNAVVALRAEEALSEAGALDERVARGEAPGPLAGVPFLVKDIEDLAGLPTTNGSLLHRDAPAADRDGLIAGRLRAAGAIPIGKSNTPEFACEGYTANLVFGVTRNPWAPEWSPGGSSGGSGAAIAAGMVPTGTATDTGGSIRIPAAFCGLVGLKPTNGLVARDPKLAWPDLTTSGPLGVSVNDVRMVLGVEAGAGAPVSLPAATLGEPDLPKRVFAAPRFTAWGPLPPAVQRAFDRALLRVERDLGLPVELVEPEAIIPAGNADQDWLIIAGRDLIEWLDRSTAKKEMERLHPATQAFVTEGLKVWRDDYVAARQRQRRFVRDLDELLGDDAVVATPTMAVEGFLAEGRLPGSDDPSTPADAYNTQVQNLTGHPAISVPAGVLPNGVPFGLQFTGPSFRDGMLLDLAEAWERANPWPEVAPGYEPFTA